MHTHEEIELYNWFCECDGALSINRSMETDRQGRVNTQHSDKKFWNSNWAMQQMTRIALVGSWCSVVVSVRDSAH